MLQSLSKHRGLLLGLLLLLRLAKERLLWLVLGLSKGAGLLLLLRLLLWLLLAKQTSALLLCRLSEKSSTMLLWLLLLCWLAEQS